MILELKNTLKEIIQIEVKEVFSVNKSVVVDETIDLFIQVLEAPIVDDTIDLNGLGNRVIAALKKLLVDGTDRNEKNIYLADLSKVEQYLKKILYLTDISLFSTISDETKGLAHLVSVCGLNPNSKNLDRANVGPENFLNHIAKVYQFRNIEAHKVPSISTKEFGELVQSILVFFIYATYLHRTKLKAILGSMILDPIPSFHSYCDGVILEFRERLSRFIHLSSMEDIKLAGSYVSEYLLKQGADKEILLREGSVNDLRKSKVPEKRMMLWAEAGLGKSTTLEYLAYVDAIERKKNLNANIPILVPLGLLTEPSISIKTFLANKLNIDIKLLEQLLEIGKLNLFLDGINEIPKDPTNTLRNLRIKEIDNLIRFSKSTFIILSNRPQDVNLFENIPVFFIQKMNDKQIKDFIQKYTGTNKPVADIINKKLDSDARIKDVVRSPLMLSRLIQIVHNEGIIPENEGMIFDKFIKSLYKRERIEKKDINFNEEVIHLLLSNLANFSLELNGTNSGLTRNQIINQFLEIKKQYGFDTDVIYCLDISCELNILEKRENVYSFVHQSYQDYYVSEFVKILFGE